VLAKRAKSAVLWSAADIFLRQGLAFCISIALARLLSPQEFGTIALLYLFTGIANAFVDSGFSAALIQRQDVTHTDESTVFWFNLAMGLSAATALWAAAPTISAFYDLPILIPLVWLMALNVFLSSAGAIHGTLLTKRLDFRTQMKIGAIATICAGVVAVALALNGYGIWALAAQSLISTLTTTFLLWAFNSWRPTFTFSCASARSLFGFGGYLFASGLLDITYSRIYTLLIGKFYSVQELGFYSRADEIKQLPVGVLSGILGRVAFPIFSSVADDKARLRRGVQMALRGVMFISVPSMLGLAAIAEPLVLALLGDQWRPAALFVQILALAGIFYPLHVINLNVLKAQGYSNLFFRLEIAKKVIGAVLISCGALFGVMGIAWSQVLVGAIGFLLNAHYTKRYLNYGPLAQLRDCLPVVGVSLLMAAGVFGASDHWNGIPLLKLIVAVLAGAAFFLALCWGFKLTALQEAMKLLPRKERDF
jgi:O-antigen/teichoic acid export membrane protein